MPTYEYVCASCANEWEEIQKISEDAVKECPKCHQQTAKRQISGGNFILKGGGWYADLYSSSKGGGAKASGGSEGTAAKTETKSEAKSESTASPAPTPSTTPSGSSSGSSSGGSSGPKT